MSGIVANGSKGVGGKICFRETREVNGTTSMNITFWNWGGSRLVLVPKWHDISNLERLLI